MYPVGLGSVFMIQHRVTGTGGFDGATEKGRAHVTLAGPLATGNVIIRAKRYGTALNGYSVQFLDPGAGVTWPATTVSQNGAVISVKLRRTALGGITATADEVAAAINAFSDYPFPIAADAASNTPTLVQAVAATPLAGGLDPARIDPARLQYVSTFANTHSGVFLLENYTDVIQIRKLQFKFALSSTAHLKVQVVNLTPGLGLTDEYGPTLDFDLTPTIDDYGVTDLRDPLLPYQALTIQCLDSLNVPQAGTVRIYAERIGFSPVGL